MTPDHLKLLTGKPAKKKKRNKYGAQKITVDGITYDSKSEYARECQLIIQKKAGIIRDLKRQVTFSLDFNDHHICNYIADWTYYTVKDGAFVVEDWKGVITDVFRLKKEMMKACHGIEVWANKKLNAHCELERPK